MATSLFQILDHLSTLGVRIIFAIPDKDCLEDVIEIYRKRGNKEKFIEDRRNDFDKFHEHTANSKFEKAYIHKQQHLYDALVEKGVKFKKGKGFKNYY